MKKPWQRFWLALVLVGAIAFVLIAHKEPPDAPVSKIAIDLAEIKTTLDRFVVDCGRLPTTAEGLQALVACPTNISRKLWLGSYLDPPEVPQDPWGHDFVYRCPGTHNKNSYDLYSNGPDGISKSGGDDPDDISNWQKPTTRRND